MLAAAQVGATKPQTLIPLALEPDRNELLRYMGYRPTSRPPRPIPQSTEELLARAQASLTPRGIFAFYDVESCSARSLTLAGVTISGAIGRFLRGSTRIAVFVVTAGAEVSSMAQAASRAGEMVDAWALDALGSWAAEATADALMTRLAADLGPHEAMTLRYSPGYCGMDLGEQKTLFGLVQAERIGVTLSPSQLMVPLKSISGLVGIGPEEIVGRRRSACSGCDDLCCPIRREER